MVDDATFAKVMIDMVKECPLVWKNLSLLSFNGRSETGCQAQLFVVCFHSL